MSRIDDWEASAIGRAMNPDNAYGFQCKDLADDYATYLFGNWISTLGAENAKDVFANANPQFWDKVLNDPNDANQVPPHGALITWNANMGGGAGHIAFVKAADANGFDVLEQNGMFVKYDANGNVIDPGKPAYEQHYSDYANVIGWLIPKLGDDGATNNQGDEEVITDSDNEYGRWNKLFMQIRGRNATRDEFRAAAVGQTWLHAMEILSDSPEADAATANQVLGAQAQGKALVDPGEYQDLKAWRIMGQDYLKQLGDMRTQEQAQQATIDSLNAQLSAAQTALKAAQAAETSQTPTSSTPATPSAPAAPTQPTTPLAPPVITPTLVTAFIAWLKGLLK